MWGDRAKTEKDREHGGGVASEDGASTLAKESSEKHQPWADDAKHTLPRSGERRGALLPSAAAPPPPPAAQCCATKAFTCADPGNKTSRSQKSCAPKSARLGVGFYLFDGVHELEVRVRGRKFELQNQAVHLVDDESEGQALEHGHFNHFGSAEHDALERVHHLLH